MYEDMDENSDSDGDSSVIGTLHMEVTDEDWDPLQYARIGRPKSPPVRPKVLAAPPTVSTEKKFGIWHKHPRRRRRKGAKKNPAESVQQLPSLPVATPRGRRPRKESDLEPEVVTTPEAGVKLESPEAQQPDLINRRRSRQPLQTTQVTPPRCRRIQKDLKQEPEDNSGNKAGIKFEPVEAPGRTRRLRKDSRLEQKVKSDTRVEVKLEMPELTSRLRSGQNSPQVAPPSGKRPHKDLAWEPEEQSDPQSKGSLDAPQAESTNRRLRRLTSQPFDPPALITFLTVLRPERTYARRPQAPRLVPPKCSAVAEEGLGPMLEASEERHSLAFCFPAPHAFSFEAEQALVQLNLNAETAREQAMQRTKYRRAYRYRLMHPTPDATQCEHCGSFYNTRPNFHMYSCPALHRKVPCPDCGRVFATSRTLRSHQVIHTRSVMKTHPCLLCGRLYASKKGVSRHMSDMHQDVMKHRHQCTICHRRFSEESGLLKHVKVHEGREPLCCPGCDKHFTYPSNMKYHKCRGRPS